MNKKCLTDLFVISRFECTYLPTATFLYETILGTDVCLEDDGGSVTNNCIGCICEASTRCDTNVTCISNGFLCGPFYISKPFWIDAGRCVQPGDNPENPDGKKSLLFTVYCLPDYNFSIFAIIKCFCRVSYWKKIILVESFHQTGKVKSFFINMVD